MVEMGEGGKVSAFGEVENLSVSKHDGTETGAEKNLAIPWP
jgi:hypothetical protein